MARRIKKRTHDPNFGEFLRENRETMYPNISAARFAKFIGITASYLSAIELGKVPPPSWDLVLLLAEKLELNARSLLEMAGHIPKDFQTSDYLAYYASNSNEKCQSYIQLLLHSIMFYEFAKYVRKEGIEVDIEDSQSLMKTFMTSGIQGKIRKKAYAIFDDKLRQFEDECKQEKEIEDEINNQ